MFPFIVLGVFAVVFVGPYLLKAYKVRRAKNLLARLRAIDKSWDAVALKDMADSVRTSVMSALEKGNVDPVRELMTGRLYERLKGKTARQFGFRKAHWLTTVISISKNIVDAVDYNDDTRDRLGFHVSFFSLSFGRGNHGPPAEFWVFVKDGDRWVVSDIDPNAGILDLASSSAYSQELSVSDNIAKMEASGRTATVEVEADELSDRPAGRKGYRTGRKDYR